MEKKDLSLLKKLVYKNKLRDNNLFRYSLLNQGFLQKDIFEGIKILISGQITMSKKTLQFEREFAKKVGAKYALMVNSGSSANLLSSFASCNPMRKNKFKYGQELLIPAVCWSTSLWPFVQAGLKPIFVDVDTDTLNINIEDFKKKITTNTKVVSVVHVLGNSANIEEIKYICKKKNLILIEDTCESLGSKYKNKFLGTFGDFGTFSFYYSHQITSGEGGMIVCHNDLDYEILLSLRSHGWSRYLKKQNYYEKKYKNLDPRFIFINSGFNVRPTEIQAAIAMNQFRRLDKVKKLKRTNRKKIINTIKNHKKWNNQLTFINESKNVNANWFGLSILINKKYKSKKARFIKYLAKKGIETRPIISGNFVNQPSFKLYNFKKNNKTLVNSQKVEDLGFFIGLQNSDIKNKDLHYLASCLLNITKI